MDFSNQRELADACQLLGIDTAGKSRQQLECDCWQEMAIRSSANTERLLETIRKSQALISEYRHLMEEKDKELAVMLTELVRRDSFDIKKFTGTRNN